MEITPQILTRIETLNVTIGWRAGLKKAHIFRNRYSLCRESHCSYDDPLPCPDGMKLCHGCAISVGFFPERAADYGAQQIEMDLK